MDLDELLSTVTLPHAIILTFDLLTQNLISMSVPAQVHTRPEFGEISSNSSVHTVF